MSDDDKNPKLGLSALRIDRGDEIAGESRAKAWRAVRWVLALAAIAFPGAKAHRRWVKSLFDAAEAGAHQSGARVDRLKVVLRDAVVRAPFSGVVVGKNVELREVVAPLSLDAQSSDETGSIATIAGLIPAVRAARLPITTALREIQLSLAPRQTDQRKARRRRGAPQDR